MVLQVAHGPKPRLVERLLGHLAHSIEGPHGQRAQEPDLVRLGDERQPVRLLVVARNLGQQFVGGNADRKSKRLNSSHANMSYAVFCLKKKQQKHKSSVLIDSCSNQQYSMRTPCAY